MKKKHTYSPKQNIKYAKGGKNTSKGGKNTYKDKKFKYGDKNHFGWFDELVTEITGPIGNLVGLGGLETTLTEWMTAAQLQQDEAGTNAVALAGQLGEGPGPSSTLSDYRDEIGISKPKKTSTEFMEGITDTIGQQTAGVLGDLGRTGKMAGIGDVLGSTDAALIGAQEKGAAMDADYQKQLTDIEKFETGQESAIVNAIANQEFQGDQDVYNLLGNLTQSGATAGGNLEGQIMTGQFDIQQQSAEAWGDIFSQGIDSLIGLFDPLGSGKEGMKVPKAEKGAKMQEYEQGGNQSNMMPAGEPDISPGKFSHEENPIDIVQKRPNGQDEKIGEMTGGEAIMPPDDLQEFEVLIEKEDKNAVFNKLKELFSKWDKRAKEHQEKLDAKESMKAMGGAKMAYKPKSKINYR